MGPFVKVLGPFSLSVTDKGNGVFEGAIALNASIGGGQAANVIKCGGSLFADMSAEQVAALGFDELNKVLPPSLQGLAASAEAAVEAEVGKL
jgi:hypothetical protein